MTYAATAKMINDHYIAGNDAAATQLYAFAIRAGKNRDKLEAAVVADHNARKSAA